MQTKWIAALTITPIVVLGAIIAANAPNPSKPDASAQDKQRIQPAYEAVLRLHSDIQANSGFSIFASHASDAQFTMDKWDAPATPEEKSRPWAQSLHSALLSFTFAARAWGNIEKDPTDPTEVTYKYKCLSDAEQSFQTAQSLLFHNQGLQ